MSAKRSRLVWIGVAVLALALAAWALVPRRGDLRHFDPVQVAQSEAGLWRSYYEHRRAELVVGLVLAEHRNFGLSPWDSGRSGIAAANAARTFQRSRSRVEAQAALPALTRHFAIVAQATGADIDPAQAARLELEWWQLRRESDSGPDAYAPAIATATAYLYGVDAHALERYARLRAQAMDLRDRRGARMSDADWAEITRLLRAAYVALREAAPTA